MVWIRPSDVPIGTVWREFEGKSKRKYWVQDITEEYKDTVANLMIYCFMKDEPLGKYNQVTTYNDVLVGGVKPYRAFLDQNVGLLCLTKDDLGNTQIAAVNCTVVTTKQDEPLQVSAHPIGKVIETVNFVSKQVCPFDHFKIDAYLSALGLYVLPEFRGDRIGMHMLKSREALCKAINIKVSCTAFTSIYSQVIADKAGFKDLYSISYSDLAKKNPTLHHRGIEEHTKNIKFMYIVYE